MSKQNKSIQEALGVNQPCPEQTHVIQSEENDQGPTVNTSETLTATKAPAAMKKGKTEDEEDMDRKLPPRHSICDAGNSKMSTASSISVDHLPVDSPQPSSGERVKGGWKKDPRPATVTRTKKPGAVSAGVNSTATSGVGARRQKDPRPVPRPEAIASGVASIVTAEGQRRKDPRPTGMSRGAASQGMAAAWERQKDPRPTESSSGGAASVDTAASWIRRKDPRPAPRPTPGVLESFNDEPTTYRDSTVDQASQTTPGAVAVPGINSDENADPEPERAGEGRAPDFASNDEAVDDPRNATLQTPIGAHVANERGQETGAERNSRADEMLREYVFANAPLVSAVVHEGDVTSRKCSPRDYSRRTLFILVLFVAIFLAAATLMGVLIPQESTAASQKGSQGSQSSAAPSSRPTIFPSHLPSLSPIDPDTLRLNSIRSILVPISGLEVLLDTSTPQYRALEWISLVDPLGLPYNTETERKRVVQRYVLAVLYYASGGEYWSNSYHFLEGIHECGWWRILDNFGDVVADGVLCTKGVEVGVVDHLRISWGNNNLTGTLPAELQYLTDLKVLEMIGNDKLGGPIPGFNENMTSLTRLRLVGNKHTGTIPSSLGRLSNLEELWLEDNDLTGTIPESFGNLQSLQYLSLINNMLNGTIPPVMGQLSSLERLELDDNGLTGTIPKSFGNLTSLRTLSLFSNMLNGTIPSMLGQVSGLRYLYLDGNRLTGEIPIEICRRKESFLLYLMVDTLTANGTEFLCECIPVEGLLGCCVVEPDYVGDGWCEDDELYDDEPYNTAACGWDGGDCLVEGLPECLGVNPSRIGNSVCDNSELYNTESCGYDGGDCCESTCEGWGCGNNGFNSCKDPTVNITCLDAEGLEGCCVEHPSQIGDGYCHPYEPYYTEACKYDNGDCPAACPDGTSPAAGKNMSACCVEHPDYIGDGECNDFEPYNTEACGYDGGDCCESTCEGWRCGQTGYNCKDPTVNITCLDADGLEGCCVEYPSQIGDGYCHPYEPYYTEACRYDNGDCPGACPEGTSPVAGKNMSACCVERPNSIGDGYCYDFKPYNTEACGYDGGDCCESTCQGSDCGKNGYDCKDPTVNVTCLDADGLERCCVKHPSQIGDGYCHPFEPYYTEACKYDNGDCPAACPEGTSPVAGKDMPACCVSDPDYVGDGYCDNDEPYNTAACVWDGGDCCEETCESSIAECGENGYDCKDPTTSSR